MLAENVDTLVGLLVLAGLAVFMVSLLKEEPWIPFWNQNNLPFPNDSNLHRRAEEDDMIPVAAADRAARAQPHKEWGEIKRAVGYCETTDCPEYLKGTFLMNHGPMFYCHRCKNVGHIEQEHSEIINRSNITKEVRVEYNFDPAQQRYRELAIVKDTSIAGPGNTYILFSPLIKTENRALKVAESILANLQRLRGPLAEGVAVRSTESKLSIDGSREDFIRELRALEAELSGSGLIARSEENDP